MQGLAGLSIRRPVLASVIVLAMVFMGVFSYAKLNIERWPNIDIPIIVVTVTDPGASPEEIESDVTNKIEDAVNSVSGIDHLGYWADDYAADQRALEAQGAELLRDDGIRCHYQLGPLKIELFHPDGRDAKKISAVLRAVADDLEP